MPILRINATDDGFLYHGSMRPMSRRLNSDGSGLGPAIIMVHGFKYDPKTPEHCPHKKLFGEKPENWPSLLGFGARQMDEGLAVAVGWFARGALKIVHERASALGKQLATLVADLRCENPQRPVHIIAHSLGSEAALNALAYLPKGSIDRMVLLTGASYTDCALQMLDTPAGRSVEVLNVTSRENDLFDVAFEKLVAPKNANDRAIGQGIPARNVANLQIDCPRALSALVQLGHPIAGSQRRICHWSSYKRGGAMAFYAAFLKQPDRLPLSTLVRMLPQDTAPRWSRFLSLPTWRAKKAGISLSKKPHALASCTITMPPMQAGRPKNEPAY